MAVFNVQFLCSATTSELTILAGYERDNRIIVVK